MTLAEPPLRMPLCALWPSLKLALNKLAPETSQLWLSFRLDCLRSHSLPGACHMDALVLRPAIRTVGRNERNAGRTHVPRGCTHWTMAGECTDR
jgi:hypothetical protein